MYSVGGCHISDCVKGLTWSPVMAGVTMPFAFPTPKFRPSNSFTMKAEKEYLRHHVCESDKLDAMA